MMALSFVRKGKDIDELRGIISKSKNDIAIIAKIETKEALENLDEIIAKADGVMVARGDLAIEIGPEHVPMVQKMIIKKCNARGIPVIVATQMLESMINSPIPTRAEVSDIANSILDGTDAIMLSEETTLGQYPIEAVQTMTKVAQEIESTMFEEGLFRSKDSLIASTTDSVSHSVVCTARDLGSKAIVALTNLGGTARMLSRHKSPHYILAFSSNEKVLNRLLLSFGCVPLYLPHMKNLESVINSVKKIVQTHIPIKKGDTCVISAGFPFGTPISTNTMIVETW
jgi:pyruvate kinase